MNGTVELAMQKNEDWDIVVRPKSGLFQVDIRGIWQYRDLIRLFVRRDFVAQYKQTILGPLWMLIQPLLSTILFSIIFARLAKIPTAGIPPLIYYLSGFIAWTYFSECVQKTSSTFTSNAAIFGKVYFPRLVTPISQVISNLFRFFAQFALFAGIYLYYYAHGLSAVPNYHAVFIPVLLIIFAGIGMGIGLLVSSLTTRFRDLNFLVGFTIQLLMYGSAVIISLDTFGDKWKSILKWNPLVWLVEGFRYALLGVGEWSWMGIGYSAACMFVLLGASAMIFGKVEKNFMDTV